MQDHIDGAGQRATAILVEIVAILRWGLLLPIAIVSAFVLMAVVGRMFLETGVWPSGSVGRFLAVVLYWGTIGSTFVLAGTLMAPEGKRHVAVALATFAFLYVGYGSYEAHTFLTAWPGTHSTALVAGAAFAALLVRKRHGRRGSEPNIR